MQTSINLSFIFKYIELWFNSRCPRLYSAKRAFFSRLAWEWDKNWQNGMYGFVGDFVCGKNIKECTCSWNFLSFKFQIWSNNFHIEICGLFRNGRHFMFEWFWFELNFCFKSVPIFWLSGEIRIHTYFSAQSAGCFCANWSAEMNVTVARNQAWCFSTPNW